MGIRVLARPNDTFSIQPPPAHADLDGPTVRINCCLGSATVVRERAKRRKLLPLFLGTDDGAHLRQCDGTDADNLALGGRARVASRDRVELSSLFF
jgi:hypothetical protein